MSDTNTSAQYWHALQMQGWMKKQMNNVYAWRKHKPLRYLSTKSPKDKIMFMYQIIHEAAHQLHKNDCFLLIASKQAATNIIDGSLINEDKALELGMGIITNHTVSKIFGSDINALVRAPSSFQPASSYSSPSYQSASYSSPQFGTNKSSISPLNYNRNRSYRTGHGSPSGSSASGRWGDNDDNNMAQQPASGASAWQWDNNNNNNNNNNNMAQQPPQNVEPSIQICMALQEKNINIKQAWESYQVWKDIMSFEQFVRSVLRDT